jgi:hypothetical protein
MPSTLHKHYTAPFIATPSPSAYITPQPLTITAAILAAFGISISSSVFNIHVVCLSQ